MNRAATAQWEGIVNVAAALELLPGTGITGSAAAVQGKVAGIIVENPPS